MKKIISLLSVVFFVFVANATVITLDEILYYDLYGIHAGVTTRYSYNGEFLNHDYIFGRNYPVSSSYSIPSTITYEGNTYIVDKITDGCFCDGYEDPHESSFIKNITLPNTIKYIGNCAFRGTGLTKFIIPENVISFSGEDHFKRCDLLTTLFYLPKSAPSNWTATTYTYVPDLVSYSSPSYKINDGNVIAMISFSEDNFNYTGQSPTTTWTNNVEGYSVELTMPTLEKEVGSYLVYIPATFTKGDESFSTEIAYRYTINAASLTAKVQNATRLYGEENPQFNVVYSGFIDGEDESVITTVPTVRTNATPLSNVGYYTISISGGTAKNYILQYKSGILNITKANLEASVNNATKLYGLPNPTFSLSYTGLKNNESTPSWEKQPSFITSAGKNSNVGEYEVNATGAIPINYELTSITPGTLTINPAPLEIKANDATRLYYDDNPTFSYVINGFVNGEDENSLDTAPSISTTADKTSGVGTYDITAEGASSQNYSILYINGTLTITPRTLTASVGNYERLYNEENPTFEVVYSGFVGNEDESVLNERAVASTTATKTSDVGTYTIKVFGGSADNYNLSYTNGTLTIDKAEQTIAWEQDLSALKVGDQVELKAIASSGLPITYTMDSNNVVDIYAVGSKSYMDCLAGGQFLMRAVQEGNKNYHASPRVSNMVTITGNVANAPLLTIMQADNGSVSIPVVNGNTYTFTIKAQTDWRIHSVTFNDEDVTGQLNDNGEYTTPAIVENSKLNVVYEKIGDDAINSAPASSIKIQGTSSGVRVIGAEAGDVIQVYSIDGVLQKSAMSEGTTTEIPLSKDKVYIVKVGAKTLKLSL